MASDWRRINLGDYIDHQKGFAFKSSEYRPNGHPIIRVSNFSTRSIDMAGCYFIDHNSVQKYESYKLRHRDVMIATVGSWPSNPASVVGRTICVPVIANGALLNQNAVLLRAKNGLDQCFLFHLLKHTAFQSYIIGKAQGSANQASITLNDIFAFEFNLPPLSEQRAIAHILGTLDDKIELNRRMNETLEAMARALFKAWFVDFEPVRAKLEGRWRRGQSLPGLPAHLYDLFPDRLVESKLGEIPKGWEIGTLGCVSKHLRRSLQPSEIASETPYIALEHMPKRCIALAEWGTANGLESNKHEFKLGEILFGKLRPYFHKVGIAPVDGVCSTDIVVVAPKSPVWFGFVLAHVSSDTFVEYTNAGSTGTKMPRTNWSEMSRYIVALPQEEVVAAFNQHVKQASEEVIVKIHESKLLAKLRDTLLPKLISGELRVPNAERILGVMI